jgi:hypothetical protein
MIHVLNSRSGVIFRVVISVLPITSGCIENVYCENFVSARLDRRIGRLLG